MNGRKNVERDMNGDQSGMIVIEATITLTIFIAVVAALIYLINIFTLHNRLQFAMNAAARTVANYSYLYQASSVRKAALTINEDFGEYTEDDVGTVNQVTDSVKKTQNTINTLKNTFGSFSDIFGSAGNVRDDLFNFDVSEDGVNDLNNDIQSVYNNYLSVKDNVDALQNDIDGTYSSYKQSYAMLKERTQNMDKTLAGLAYLAFNMGADFLKSLIAENLASALTKQNLEVSDGSSADAFLKRFGVDEGFDGLDFSGSTVFWDKNYSMIDFVAEYDVNMSFAGLIMASPSIHVVQRVTVPAWLNGDEGEVIQEDDGSLVVKVPSYSRESDDEGE